MSAKECSECDKRPVLSDSVHVLHGSTGRQAMTSSSSSSSRSSNTAADLLKTIGKGDLLSLSRAPFAANEGVRLVISVASDKARESNTLAKKPPARASAEPVQTVANTGHTRIQNHAAIPESSVRAMKRLAVESTVELEPNHCSAALGGKLHANAADDSMEFWD